LIRVSFSKIQAKFYYIPCLAACAAILLPQVVWAQLSPAARVIDDGDAGFSLNDSAMWSRLGNLGHNRDMLQSLGPSPSISATWRFSVNPGEYRVSVTYLDDVDVFYRTPYTTNAVYTISSAGAQLATRTISQRTVASDRSLDGVGFKDLGTVTITLNELVVKVMRTDGLVTVSDAVWVERTDGTAIPAPKISVINPPNSPLSGGVPIVVTGLNFSQGAKVKFGSTFAASTTFVSATELVATAPAHAAGTVDLSVVNQDGLEGALLAAFTFAKARIVDNADPNFLHTTEPGWATVGFAGGSYKDEFKYSASAATAVGTFELPVLNNKQHKVAITWPASTAPYNGPYQSAAVFKVLDGQNVLLSRTINLQVPPNDFNELGLGWLNLGTFTFTSGKLKVVGAQPTAKLLLFDALRVEDLNPDNNTPAAPLNLRIETE
jgi:hypothetical protein